MKKTILTAFTLLSIVGYGQVEIKSTKSPKSETIGKVSPMGSFTAELVEYTMDGDTSYTLFYRNMKYLNITDVKSVTFNGGKKDINGLKEVFLSAFKDENKNNKDFMISLKLGKDAVFVTTYKSLGYTGMKMITDYGYMELSEKQVNKLFGR